MAEEKTMRLSQVARKLNVGRTTIIDFLANKGFEVDSSPNYKVTAEQFSMLSKEFAVSAYEKEKTSGLTKGTKHKVKKTETLIAEDIRAVIKDSNFSSDLFKLTITGKTGSIKYNNTDYFLRYERNDIGDYNIDCNPNITIATTKINSPIPYVKFWLEQIEKVEEYPTYQIGLDKLRQEIETLINISSLDEKWFSIKQSDELISITFNKDDTSVFLSVELIDKTFSVQYIIPEDDNAKEYTTDNMGQVSSWFENWLSLINENNTESKLSEENTTSDLKKDANLLPDNPSEIDDLGRDALMDVTADKIDKLWSSFKEEENHNYTILIDGEWGSGKTSMLGFLEDHLRARKWNIVKYNAWENQRLDDQWWVFINKVSQKLSSKKNHQWWTFKMKNYKTIIIGVALIVVISLGLIFFPGEENGFKTIGGIIGLIGSIWITIGSITKNFLYGRVTSSELLKNNTSDPYLPIKERFNKVIRDNNNKVAIFIDDLDRCETEATVGLLEGIQTLFKDTQVLYVIAADGNWISNCFNNQYVQFNGLGKDGHSIGNKFLQKSFQLLLEVPKMSHDDHQKMWHRFLGSKQKGNEKPKIQEDSFRQKTNEKIEQAENIDELKESVKGAQFEERKKAAEKVEEIVEEQKSHLLMEYLDYMPKNLRQMKRLINQYVIKYQSLFIAGTESEITDDDLVRYIIFAMKYPDFDSDIKKGKKSLETIINDNKELKELLGDNITTELIRNYL